MNTSESLLLIKSLNLLAQFYENVDLVTYGNEYISIHERNVKALTSLAKERDSQFILELTSNFPPLTAAEVDHFKAKTKKEHSLLTVAAGGFIGGIANLIKNKGNSTGMIKKKLKQFQTLNEKLAKIVEDPIYEELYLATKE